MQINSASSGPAAERGHVLLMAGSPLGRRRNHVRAAENLHAFAAVPASVLLRSTVPADMVQLADSAEPQSVLTRLRTAAATRGPLLVYLTGQLVADRRQRQPHLALARTTAHTVRYTALPWSWLRDVLRQRSHSTAVIADLSADRTVWPLLSADSAPFSDGLPLYAVITPPGAAAQQEPGPTAYTRRLAELLRSSPARQPLDQLHHMAASHARLPDGTLVLVGRAVADGTAAASAVNAPHVDAAPTPEPISAPVSAPTVAPRTVTAGTSTRTPPGPAATSQSGVSAEFVPAAEPAAPPMAPPTAQVPAEVPAPLRAPLPAAPDPSSATDPHPAIQRAATEGRHTEAAAMAAAWEQYALRTSGPASAEARHWQEVRADLARLAGDPARAAELWMAVARSHLSDSTGDEARLNAAVDNAHHCWERVTDIARARQLGQELVGLRHEAPGRDRRSLRAAQRRMARLASATQSAPGSVRPSARSG